MAGHYRTLKVRRSSLPGRQWAIRESNLLVWLSAGRTTQTVQKAGQSLPMECRRSHLVRAHWRGTHGAAHQDENQFFIRVEKDVQHYLTHGTAVSAGVQAVFAETHSNILHETASRRPSSRFPTTRQPRDYNV